MRIFFIVAALALALTYQQAVAHSYKAGDVLIGHPWMKSAEAGADAAVGMALYNRGNKPQRLTQASTELAEEAVIVTQQPNGLVPLKDYPLPSGQPVLFQDKLMKPHIRLKGLKRAVKDGDEIPLLLTITGQPRPVPVTVVVGESEHGESQTK